MSAKERTDDYMTEIQNLKEKFINAERGGFKSIDRLMKDYLERYAEDLSALKSLVFALNGRYLDLTCQDNPLDTLYAMMGREARKRHDRVWRNTKTEEE